MVAAHSIDIVLETAKFALALALEALPLPLAGLVLVVLDAGVSLPFAVLPWTPSSAITLATTSTTSVTATTRIVARVATGIVNTLSISH
jgi:hypothetical protein